MVSAGRLLTERREMGIGRTGMPTWRKEAVVNGEGAANGLIPAKQEPERVGGSSHHLLVSTSIWR